MSRLDMLRRRLGITPWGVVPIHGAANGPKTLTPRDQNDYAPAPPTDAAEPTTRL